MKNYRKLNNDEISQLEKNFCTAVNWDDIEVSSTFDASYVSHTRFSGKIKIGILEKEFLLAGGIKKHSAIRNATLHNVTIGDNCLIENVKNYIANYKIGDDVFIENIDIIFVEDQSFFGNGTAVSVLNETGGREVYIHDQLSAHQAYMIALYRHRPLFIKSMKDIIDKYTSKKKADIGQIGNHVKIANSGCILNTYIGNYCEIEGVSRLENGSINSNRHAPVYIGYNVICENFIISDGASIKDGCILTRCFVGQSCELKHNYSASDSLFFSNCQGANGEACSIFAGPFTVTHHKSTLLIAGMFSFMNAGSGSNQSNHMYKLGPIHQGIMERGAKTTSDSYILWPAKVGAFSLVMGRHVNHSDTSDLPFSYLIEEQNTTYLVPAVNLKSIGTIRDAQKWPIRDKRTTNNRLDQINYNLLSPYTIQKMINGITLLKKLQRISGETSNTYYYQSAKIKRSSLVNGIFLYRTAIHKFLGNSLIKRLEGVRFSSNEEIRSLLKPSTTIGSGEWVDIAGLIAPKSEIELLITQIENRELTSTTSLHKRFMEIHNNYYEYEWTWAYNNILNFYNLNPEEITADDIINIVNYWKEAVIGLDKMLYEDAQKEFSLSFMTGFGTDGSHKERTLDFEQVRGLFESNSFVTAILEHMTVKENLGNELIKRIHHLQKRDKNSFLQT